MQADVLSDVLWLKRIDYSGEGKWRLRRCECDGSEPKIRCYDVNGTETEQVTTSGAVLGSQLKLKILLKDVSDGIYTTRLTVKLLEATNLLVADNTKDNDKIRRRCNPIV